jgi:type III pantothenate kinase
VDGAYVGGAILPGVTVSLEALFTRAAKLPQIPLVAPDRAIGRTTVESIQSGVMFGYAGAIDALAERIAGELGSGTTVLATGGLGGIFMGLCRTLERYEPNLTLDGLRLAWDRQP